MMQCGSFVSCFYIWGIYFVHEEFPCDGWLGYKSHNNTAAPKTIIWIFYAGELVSHPQRGVLQLFIYKDAWKGFDKQAYLLS